MSADADRLFRILLSFLSLAALVLFAACRSESPPAGAAGRGGGGAATRPVVHVTGIPDENPTELHRKYAPMVAYLEERLAAEVKYVPVTDYGAAVEALRSGKVDFAWLGGFTFVQARVLAGAVPLCMRDIDRDFKTVFIANSAAGIEKPEDMRGKTFAFGAKSSTSGHLMPRHFLTTTFGIAPDRDFAGEPVYSGAHDATIKAVESGKVQAGALNVEVWDRMNAEGKVDTGKVKPVWKTPGYVDYVWAARREVEPGIRDRFTTAFLALEGGRPEHAAVLALQGARKFVPASPADFDAIERVARSTGLLK